MIPKKTNIYVLFVENTKIQKGKRKERKEVKVSINLVWYLSLN